MPLPALLDKLTDYLQATLANDGTIRSLTGGSSADPRVYHYYQAPAEIPAGGAFLSWAHLSGSREIGGVREPVFSVRIYAYNTAKAYQIETRINQLFDQTVHTITGAGRTVTAMINDQDLYDQTNKFPGREVHIKFGALTTMQ